MKLLYTLLLLPLLIPSVFADVPPEQRDEVDHLTRFVRSSDCRLERNGTFYNGEQALEHILRKYDYYREEINSTEDFIADSASKSTLSGRPYRVHCEGQTPVHSQDWLLKELKRYRKSVNSR